MAADYGYSAGSLAEARVNGRPATRYAYDTSLRLTRVESPGDGTVQLAYDTRGRVSRRVFADGAVERYEYDDLARTVRIIDSTGAVVQIVRSADGSQEEIVRFHQAPDLHAVRRGRTSGERDRTDRPHHELHLRRPWTSDLVERRGCRIPLPVPR